MITITSEDVEAIVQSLLTRLAEQSVNVDTLEEITDTSDLGTLPVYKGNTEELYKVKVSTLAQPAVEAAGRVNEIYDSTMQAVQSANDTFVAAQAELQLAENALSAALDRFNSTSNSIDSLLTDIGGLKGQIGNYKIEVISPEDYELIQDEDKDENTLYFVFEL